MLLRLVSPPISGVLYSTDGCCLGKALLRVQIRLEFKFETVDNTIQSVLHLEHSSSHQILSNVIMLHDGLQLHFRPLV